MYNLLKIIFAGSDEFAAYHLKQLIYYKYNIIGVLVKKNNYLIKGKRVLLNSVKKIAEDNNIDVYQLSSLNSYESQKLIANLSPDIIIVVSYGLKLPKEILDIPRFGCVNVHGSLLPRWRGAAPIQRSLLAGDIETGITIIQMNNELDTGDIIYKISCPILNTDTSATLSKKLAELGSIGLVETIKKIVKKEIKYTVQDNSLATYAKKIHKEEACINWHLPAVIIERYIRAFNPWPVSYFKIKEQIIKVWQASVISISINKIPGTIIKANKNGIKIATKEGILNIEFLQIAGKKPMSVQDFLNSRLDWFIPGNHL